MMHRKSKLLIILLGMMFACLLVPFGYSTDATEGVWETSFGGTGADFGYSVQVTGDGGYIITGTTQSFGAGGWDVYLVKTDSHGNEEWSRTFGGTNYDYGYSVQVTGDGGYIITGSTVSYGAGLRDVYLVKTDSGGNLVWEKTFGGTGADFGRSVQVTSDGGYIITGYSSSFGAGGNGVYLLKTDSGGNLVWEKTFGGTGSEVGYSVQVAGDGGYIITGYTRSSGAGGEDVYLVKTDSGGNLVWEKTFGGTREDYGRSVQVTSDGGYIITGYTESSGAGGADVYLVKTDSDGNLVWEKTFGDTNHDNGQSVQVTSDGGYILTGTKSSPDALQRNVYLVKTDSNGNLVWEKTFGGIIESHGYSVQMTGDGGYIITGYTRTSGVSQNVYLVKTDSQGHEETYAALIVDVVVPSEVTSEEVFTVEITLSYEFTEPTEISLGIKNASSDTLIVDVAESLVGAGTKTYSFELTASEVGTWALAADVWYKSDGEWVHDEVDWFELFDVQVTVEPVAEVYSARVVDVVAPNEVYAGEVFTVELTVSYEFSESTAMSPGIYDFGTDDWIAEEYETLVGAGSKTYSLELTAPEEVGAWSLRADVWYSSEGGWGHGEGDWFEYYDVQVIAGHDETYFAQIVDLVAPSAVYAGESFTVEFTVSYEFTEPTEMGFGIVDIETDIYVVNTYDTLLGAGTKTYGFVLTASEVGTWALAADVWYKSDGEWVQDEVGWIDYFDVQVIAVYEETYNAWIVDVVVPNDVYVGELFTVEVTVSYEFTMPTVMRTGITKLASETPKVEDSETLVGAGTKTYNFDYMAPDYETPWSFFAEVDYLFEGEWIHDEIMWSELFFVQVMERPDGGTSSAWIVDVDSPSEVYAGEDFIVEVTVFYEFSELTEMRIAMVDIEAETLIGNIYGTFVGAETETNSFELTAPREVGFWSLETSVGYLVDGEVTYDDNNWGAQFYVEVVPLPEGTYSAWIVDIEAPNEVFVGEEFTVETTVSYTFPEPTEIIPYIYDMIDDTNIVEDSDVLVGAGTKTYSLELTAPEDVGVWLLFTSAEYLVDGEWLNAEADLTLLFGVEVTAGSMEGTYSASIVEVVAPSEVPAGEVFTVDVTVSYDFSELTKMSPGIYDVATDTWIAEDYETHVGAGTKTYSFLLTAPDDGLWVLEASVWYELNGEMVHDDVDYLESFNIRVIEDDGNGGGIPGFPFEAIILGLLIGFYLTSRRTSLDLGLSTQ